MSNDLVSLLRRSAVDWDGMQASDLEPVVHELTCGDVMAAANRMEADTKLIQEMREALESAKEELYQISHSGGDPDDEANMDSYAAAYRECKHALSKAKSQQEGETE